MKKGLFLLFTAIWMCLTAKSQSFPVPVMTDHRHYTVANTHSHNDYEQPIPFWMAWQEQFGSIEADIWWVNGQLLIGHNREEIKAGKTLEQYYVKPLLSCIGNNNGHPFADSSRPLQILIDVKTDSTASLNALIALLDKYPALEKTAAIKWVISGNRPPVALYPSFPSFIAFDGILHDHYSPEALSKIVMMSDDLHYYTHWNGLDPIPDTAKAKIRAAIARSHDLHLPVRFWDAPDFQNAWEQLIQLRVDFINTDHISKLAAFLNDGTGPSNGKP
jgi:alkaline phosphatase